MKEVPQPGMSEHWSCVRQCQTKNGDTSGIRSKGIAEGVSNAFWMVFSFSFDG